MVFQGKTDRSDIVNFSANYTLLLACLYYSMNCRLSFIPPAIQHMTTEIQCQNGQNSEFPTAISNLSLSKGPETWMEIVLLLFSLVPFSKRSSQHENSLTKPHTP